MVEEVFDHAANVAVLGHHDSRFPTVIHRLQLPESVRLVDRHARRHVLLLVQRILQTTVHETVKTKGNDYTITMVVTSLFFFWYNSFGETCRVCEGIFSIIFGDGK